LKSAVNPLPLATVPPDQFPVVDHNPPLVACVHVPEAPRAAAHDSIGTAPTAIASRAARASAVLLRNEPLDRLPTRMQPPGFKQRGDSAARGSVLTACRYAKSLSLAKCTS